MPFLIPFIIGGGSVLATMGAAFGIGKAAASDNTRVTPPSQSSGVDYMQIGVLLILGFMGIALIGTVRKALK